MGDAVGGPVKNNGAGLTGLLAWLREAPAGPTVPAARILARLEEVLPVDNLTPFEATEPTWRERLWTAPSETRIGRQELLEAVGRSEHWLYRHSGAKAKCSRIPCRKLDGELVFVVGEVRRWLLEHEEAVVAGRSVSLVAPVKRRREIQ